MTQEQKAKAYDEAVKKVKDYYEGKTKMYSDIEQTLDLLFPELKDSEDERIRKAIINYLRQRLDRSPSIPAAIGSWIDWLEKQAQKPNNKVEPMFHDGEWITNGDYTWKIVEVKPLDYILQSQDGNIVDDTISHVDEQFHFFTIEDAKDGDILISFCNQPFIYNGKFIENVVGGYCGFDVNGNFVVEKYIKECNWTCNENIKPATKEQCNALMKAMSDAGYTFDFEKKELKKIEPRFKVGDRITNGSIVGKIHSVEKNHYGYKTADERYHGLPFKVQDQWELVEQNPAWSEQDIRILSNIQLFINYSRNYYSESRCDEAKCWLKSIKDRVQPKQEWSEENDDEAWLNDIICKVESDCTLNKDEKDWLKSLRPLNRWKPSDEQIKAVKEAACYSSVFSEKTIDNLISLSKQLKKLREE